VGVSDDAPLSAGEYCRAIESYLCRENGGHLVRIVGPVFQTVVGWHAQGIPIGIVRQGVDRTLARDRAKPSRGAKRPVRIEFCESDILDAFAAWKRAVGIGMASDREPARATTQDGDPDPGSGSAIRIADPDRRSGSLGAHIDRAMQKLTQALLDLPRFAPAEAAAANAAMDAALADLDRLRGEARGARGTARAAAIDALTEAGRRLDTALVAALAPDAAQELSRAARAELAPFAARMAPADAAAAEAAALARLARERFRAPAIAPGA
jgi:hypothetical protein